MRDGLKPFLSNMAPILRPSEKAMAAGPELKEERDALEALESLGYSVREAREALHQVPPSVQGTSRRVKEALRILGGSKS